MTPASPSWPSFRNVAWTFIPIFTFSGLTSISCEVRQPPARSDDLAVSGLPGKLPHDLDRLRNSGGADRLAAGLQATRGVHGDLSVQRGEAVRGRGATLPLLDEPEVLDREDLGNRE